MSSTNNEKSADMEETSVAIKDFLDVVLEKTFENVPPNLAESHSMIPEEASEAVSEILDQILEKTFKNVAHTVCLVVAEVVADVVTETEFQTRIPILCSRVSCSMKGSLTSLPCQWCILSMFWLAFENCIRHRCGCWDLRNILLVITPVEWPHQEPDAHVVHCYRLDNSKHCAATKVSRKELVQIERHYGQDTFRMVKSSRFIDLVDAAGNTRIRSEIFDLINEASKTTQFTWYKGRSVKLTYCGHARKSRVFSSASRKFSDLWSLRQPKIPVRMQVPLRSVVRETSDLQAEASISRIETGAWRRDQLTKSARVHEDRQRERQSSSSGTYIRHRSSPELRPRTRQFVIIEICKGSAGDWQRDQPTKSTRGHKDRQRKSSSSSCGTYSISPSSSEIWPVNSLEITEISNESAGDWQRDQPSNSARVHMDRQRRHHSSSFGTYSRSFSSSDLWALTRQPLEITEIIEESLPEIELGTVPAIEQVEDSSSYHTILEPGYDYIFDCPLGPHAFKLLPPVLPLSFSNAAFCFLEEKLRLRRACGAFLKLRNLVEQINQRLRPRLDHLACFFCLAQDLQFKIYLRRDDSFGLHVRRFQMDCFVFDDRKEYIASIGLMETQLHALARVFPGARQNFRFIENPFELTTVPVRVSKCLETVMDRRSWYKSLGELALARFRPPMAVLELPEL